MYALLALGLILGPGDEGADYRLGLELFMRGEFDAAVAPLVRATQKSPRSALAWKALGVVYGAKQDYASAEEPLQKACALEPALEDACYYLGRVRYALNRFEGALEALHQALRTDRRPWRVHSGIGEALEALGRAAEAEESFKKAYRVVEAADPGPGVSYGVFLFRQGRIAESLRLLEEAATRFPASAAAHLQLGRVLAQTNRLPDAISHLEKAVALDPASAQAHLVLANACFRAGRKEDGYKHAEAAGQSVRTTK